MLPTLLLFTHKGPGFPYLKSFGNVSKLECSFVICPQRLYVPEGRDPAVPKPLDWSPGPAEQCFLKAVGLESGKRHTSCILRSQTRAAHFSTTTIPTRWRTHCLGKWPPAFSGSSNTTPASFCVSPSPLFHPFCR